MAYFVRTWIPTETNQQQLVDDAWIYDAGDKHGILIQKASGKQYWFLVSIETRSRYDEGIQETGTVLEDSNIPKDFFSIEKYSARLELQPGSLQIWFPNWMILWTQTQAQEQSQAQSQPPQVQQQRQPSRPPRQQQQRLLQRPPPSSAQPPTSEMPVSPGPLKSTYETRVAGQPSSRNKNKPLPKQKALSSSDSASHVQHSVQAPTMPVEHPPPMLLHENNAPLYPESAPWTSLSQQSPYSRPPPELSAESAEPPSTSRRLKGSAKHLRGPRARHPHESVLAHPTSQAPSSHPQTS